MFTIPRLLALHDQAPSSSALADCLGDQYLYARNRVFRNVRNSFLQYGFRFSSADTQLWRDYQTFPLFCLQVILDQKTVPYIDTASSFRHLVRNLPPDFTVDAAFLLKIIKRNYLLHEASHCVADAVLTSGRFLRNDTRVTSAQAAVVQALLSEAFANTVERVAWALSGPGPDLLFFVLNSYVDHKNARLKMLQDLIGRFGISNVFRLSSYCFFVNNAARRSPTEEELRSFLPWAFQGENVGLSAYEEITNAIREVLCLNQPFVDEASPVYFRLFGQEREFLEMAEAPVDADRLNKMGVFDAVEQLGSIALKEN